jgi:hypothetical protein
LQVEHPVWCGDSSTFDFYATLAGVLGPALIRDEVVQVRQSRQKRLLAALGIMEPLHGEQFPLDGVVGLIQEGAGDGHLGVLKDHIPARLLGLHPAPDALPVGFPCGVGDAVHKAAEPLAQGHHTQTLALTHPIGVCSGYV